MWRISFKPSLDPHCRVNLILPHLILPRHFHEYYTIGTARKNETRDWIAMSFYLVTGNLLLAVASELTPFFRAGERGTLMHTIHMLSEIIIVL